MKKIISIFILMSLFCNFSFAKASDCDFKTGIKPLSDGNYEYSKDCHLKVGELVQNSNIKDQQIKDLNQAIQLKDLAIKASDDRSNLWYNTSQDLEGRVQKIDEEQKHNELLWLGMGVLGTVLTGYMVAKLIGR